MVDVAARAERYVATFPENEELLRWLRQEVPEPLLEPSRRIVDPHHHLWDHRRLPDGAGYRTKVYTLHEVLEDVNDGHNVKGTVYVQAHSFHWRRRGTSPNPAYAPAGEVEYCQGIAAACDSGIYGRSREDPGPRVCMGIQGTVDLKNPQAPAVLQYMKEISRNFRGVRSPLPNVRGDAGGASADAAFKRGFRALAELGLVYDVWLGEYDPAALPTLQRLAMEFPTVPIVLDHLGGIVGPRLSSAEKEAWRADLASLAAACPNVVCKVGGIQMVVNGWGWEKRPGGPIGSEELCEATWPWYSHAIACFTPSRCMFESNFPVDKDTVSYRTLWNSFKRTAEKAGLTDAEKDDIFYGTACRTYRLDPDAGPGPPPRVSISDKPTSVEKAKL